MCANDPESRPTCAQLLKHIYFQGNFVSPGEAHTLKSQLKIVEEENQHLKENNRHLSGKLEDLEGLQRRYRAYELMMNVKDQLLEEQAVKIANLEKELMRVKSSPPLHTNINVQ